MFKLTSKNFYRLIALIILILIFVVSALLFFVTGSKYVIEMGWNGKDVVGADDDHNDLSYEVQTPLGISRPIDFVNAIASGYTYVQLSENLDGPLIMTGNSLDLKNDLTLDLRGNEIERNSRDALISISEGTKLTIIDSLGGGGLYNPTGNVVALNGGELNVFGGKFESGPRPSDYYSKLSLTLNTGSVDMLKGDSGSGNWPLLPVRTLNGKKYGNVYFDTKVGNIPADTYCYMAINGETSDDVASFDMSQASFVYTYQYNDDSVVVFGFCETVTLSNPNSTSAPNYAALQMSGGKLNVNVNDSHGSAMDDGSFYSYFGTPSTSCIYMTGGEMQVSTSGNFATVNPADLPDGCPAGNGEGSCIICNSAAGTSGGVLNITELKSATAYNGSVIAMQGGSLTIRNAHSFTKNATLSHTDQPRSMNDATIGLSAMDAAIFIRGGTIDIEDSNFVVNKNISPDTCKYSTTYGILARGIDNVDSSLTCVDVNFLIYGARSYGIYATRGNLTLTGGNISMVSDNHCYGVYAANMGTKDVDAVRVILNDTDINGATGLSGSQLLYQTYVGTNPADGVGELGTSSNARVASVGVYLNSFDSGVSDGTREGGSVKLNGSNITSQEIGVAVNSGTLTLNGGGSITTYNGSAVALLGGDIIFNEKMSDDSVAKYVVDSQINRKGNGVTKDENGYDTTCTVSSDADADAAGTHQYDLFLPWQVIFTGTGGSEASPEQIANVEPYENLNGIRVMGGKFVCDGYLDMNFRGLYNDYNMYGIKPEDPVVFDNIVIKSFAIVAGTSANTAVGDSGSINIKRGHIVNTVGGGVKVEGGKIELGTQETTSALGDLDSLVVETRGGVHGKTGYNVADGVTHDTWKFYPNLSGGHAVIARDGDITVYSGSYTANYCNGVAATGSNTNVTIHGGTFTGNMEHAGGTFTHTYQTATGPASHYGLKVIGGATLKIYGGVFDGKNGGAFVRGSAQNNAANVYIYAGTFGSAGGQDGFNVYDYANVYFGAYLQSDLSKYSASDIKNLIKVYAMRFPVAANPIQTPSYIKIYIYYGSYLCSYQSGDNLSYGVGGIDTTAKNITFYIYNTTSYIGYTTGIKSALIRYNPYQTDEEKNKATAVANSINYGYDTGITRYLGYTGQPSEFMPFWK